MRAILIGILCVSACSHVPEIPPSGRVDVAGFMRQVDETQVAWTRESLEALFGSQPRERQSGNERILIFYGIEITLTGSEISRIALIDARYTSPEGLRIGYARDMVRTALGPPPEGDTDTWHYRTEHGTPIIVSWQADRIVRLEWHYGQRGR